MAVIIRFILPIRKLRHKPSKSQEKRGGKKRQDKLKTNSKLSDLNPTISTITLNVWYKHN